MRWHRRGWLWLWLCLPALPLLLTQAAPWEASAVALRKRDSLDSLDLRWEDDYYRKSDGVYCKKCPAGTHLIKECEEQGGSSTCQSCGPGEYMEYPNTFPSCQECSKCREDQVELSPCQPQRNTVCACRNGTFCPPEHPCEMCQKCQPRCPDGQVVLKPCTPTSDLECGPDTATFPSYLTGGIIAGIVIVILIAIGIGIGTALCCWKQPCSSPGDESPSSKKPFEIVLQKLRRCKRENSGREDNIPNERTERQLRERLAIERQVPLGQRERVSNCCCSLVGAVGHCHCRSGTVIPGVTLSLQEMLPSKSERLWRTLVPPPGTEPSQALKSTFYTFGKKVPRDDWRRFGLNLNLEDIDIPMGQSLDDFYNMMRRWQNREGSKASVNTLLDTLDRLSLGGVAEDICKTLVQERGFEYETS
ncbi:tumor necrosis factor receptor superfamily member 10B [Zonotrichia leucophrys gambelii]|uniref:tumor necrosis factor receptor superfamily member 10B n=1 Tax=Zonotrichia leucophrys gambelii TaxID=257770 RepID=UPI003140B5CA